MATVTIQAHAPLSPRARAIVALDTPTLNAARSIVDALGADCDFYKVGSELFTVAGPRVVEWLLGREKDVFLDLKFHDIPNTVRGASRNVAAIGARLLTVHAVGGSQMIRAAVEGAGERCGVLAVTVLTSLDAGALGTTLGRAVGSMSEEVLRAADMAHASGAHGVVCAGAEAAAVHAKFGDALAILIPGIRTEGSPAHDQARVVTPREAAHAGASYIVAGRAVTAAPDPLTAFREIIAELKVAA
ncbi:MAG: orotidine-5'-phosphate decarboxylase [Gemmatimonadaceae bacterium]